MFTVGWCCLSLLTGNAHLAYLWSEITTLPDWGAVSRLALETLFPSLVVLLLVIYINRLRSLARTQGLDISITGWQYG